MAGNEPKWMDGPPVVLDAWYLYKPADPRKSVVALFYSTGASLHYSTGASLHRWTERNPGARLYGPIEKDE